MVKGLNFYQNIQIPQPVVFKGKQKQATTTNPIENVNLGGVDVLASYNIAFMQKQQDKFDIPLLKPISIPQDINLIDGERIYNSKGHLECIIKETYDKKYIYRQPNDKNVVLDVIDKVTGTKEIEQINNIYDGKLRIMVYKFDKITGKRIGGAQYKNSNPIDKWKMIHKPDGSEERINFDFKEGLYSVCNDNGFKEYDINKNLIGEYQHEQKSNGYNKKETMYSFNKPIITKNQEVRGKVSEKYSAYVKNPNLQRAERPEIVTNIDNIEGQKTYYSNGQLESVRTLEGKLYEQSFDKNVITITEGNKTICFSKEIDYNRIRCSIEEDLGNATRKSFYYDIENDADGSVTYTKGNIEKFLCFDNNGRPSMYNENDLSKEDYKKQLIFGVDYAQDGSVIDVYKSFDERSL